MLLRRHLLLSLWATAFIGITLIALSAWHDSAQERREQLYIQETNMLRTHAEHIACSISQSRQALAGLARFSWVRDCLRPSFTMAEKHDARVRAIPFLHALNNCLPSSMPLAILDKQGDVIAASSPALPAFDKESLQKALQGHSVLYYSGARTPLGILEPVWDENIVIGAVLRLLDVTIFTAHTASLTAQLPTQGILLVNERGTLLDDLSSNTQKHTEPDWIQAAIAGNTMQQHEWNGTQYITLSQQIENTNWSLLALLPVPALNDLLNAVPFKMSWIVALIFMMSAITLLLHLFSSEWHVKSAVIKELVHDFDFTIPKDLQDIQYIIAVIHEMKKKILSLDALINVKNREMTDMQKKMQAYIDDLERFNMLSAGREERVLALKKEVNFAIRSLGQTPPYASVECDAAHASSEKSLLDDMLLNIPDVLDFFPVEDLRKMITAFCDIVHVTVLISDSYGNLLVQSSQGCPCARIHTQNSLVRTLCDHNCDKAAQTHHNDTTQCIQTCFAGLSTASLPITIEGNYLGNLVLRGFHQTPPDRAQLEQQGKDFGFDPAHYADAVCALPVIAVDKVPTIISFLLQYIQMAIKLVTEQSQLFNHAEELKKRKHIALSIAEDADAERQHSALHSAQLEHSMRALESKFARKHRILDFISRNSTQGILCINSEDKIYFANSCALTMLGYTADALHTKSLSSILGTFPIDSCQILTQKNVDEEQYTFITTLRTHDQIPLSVHVYLYTLCSNEKETVVIFEKMLREHNDESSEQSAMHTSPHFR